MPVLVNVAIIHVSEAKTACSVQVLTDTAKFKSILQFKQPVPANASGKLAECTTAALQRNFQRGPHQRLTCRHLCCLQHTPFSSALCGSRAFTASWRKPEASCQISGSQASVLIHDGCFSPTYHRDANEKHFFFLASRLPGDVLCSAGSAVKVSRGAGSRTFDVPDLRSRHQAYVLAPCIQQL